jgi:hypothetical protein
LRDLLAKCKLQVGLSESLVCVVSNSLTPPGPATKQNQTVLFYSNNITQFCKWLESLLKVSSVSRAKKLEGEGEAGAAKLMKPRGELNFNGRIGL